MYLLQLVCKRKRILASKKGPLTTNDMMTKEEEAEAALFLSCLEWVTDCHIEIKFCLFSNALKKHKMKMKFSKRIICSMCANAI